MAASLLIEEESGTYSGRIRHSHNGYYAGDFSHTPRSGSELRESDPGRRDAPPALAVVAHRRRHTFRRPTSRPPQTSSVTRMPST